MLLYHLRSFQEERLNHALAFRRGERENNNNKSTLQRSTGTCAEIISAGCNRTGCRFSFWNTFIIIIIIMGCWVTCLCRRHIRRNLQQIPPPVHSARSRGMKMSWSSIAAQTHLLFQSQVTKKDIWAQKLLLKTLSKHL